MPHKSALPFLGASSFCEACLRLRGQDAQSPPVPIQVNKLFHLKLILGIVSGIYYIVDCTRYLLLYCGLYQVPPLCATADQEEKTRKEGEDPVSKGCSEERQVSGHAPQQGEQR